MTKLSNEKLRTLKSATKRKLVNHCETVDSYSAGWFHEYLCNILEEAFHKVKKGEPVRIILEVPPRHGKSRTSTILFPSWILGQQPDWPIIISSYSGELASDFGHATREIMDSSIYKSVCDTRLKVDTRAKSKWMTEEGGSYTAVGIGGAITGKGFKIGVIDDPFKNRKEADSELIRDNVWKWYKSTFYTRQEGISAIIVIMTRWHQDDLVGRLLEEQEKLAESGLENIDKWKRIRFPAIAEEEEDFRMEGEPLWEEKFPLVDLERKRNNLGIMEFESLYQQHPLASELMEFKEEYFTYFEEKDLPDKMDIDITVDPAISQKKEACNTAITAVGKGPKDPNWYILDFEASKMTPFVLIDETFKMYKELKKLYPDADINVYVEGVAYQESLRYYFEEKMIEEEYYFMLSTFKENSEKLGRIRGLVPLYKVGVIKHRRWMKDLEKEAVNFPQGKTLDILDALSFQLQIKMNTDKKKKKKKKQTMIERRAERIRGPQKESIVEQTYL